MTTFVTAKQFENIRSGQTYFYITIDQFGNVKIESSMPTGKKIKSYLQEEKAGKRFFNRKSNLNLHSQSLYFPSYKLFWTRNSANKFIQENCHRSGFQQHDVLNVVKRVRTRQV
jgi:hypothetical protein